jgi:type IV secretion system protein VirB10
MSEHNSATNEDITRSTVDVINEKMNNYNQSTIMDDADPDNVTDNSVALKKKRFSLSSEKLKGVVRINKRPLIIVVVLLGVIGFVMIIGLANRNHKEDVTTVESVEVGTSSNDNAILAMKMDIDTFNELKRKDEARKQQELIDAENARLRDMQPKPVVPTPPPLRGTIEHPYTKENNQQSRNFIQQPMNDPQEKERQRLLDEQKRQAKMQAMAGDMMVDIQNNRLAHKKQQMDGQQKAVFNPQGSIEQVDVQDDMSAFKAEAEKDIHSNTNIALKNKPFNGKIITAGSVIPAALVTAMNSDMPGPVFAMVTTDVYDSISGQSLLIPKGSKLIGRYNSNVTYGVTRSFVVWARVIFPDASSYSISSMSGADLAGNVGLDADVNNHWGKIITAAAMSSVFTGAVAYASPQQATGGMNGITPGQAASSQFGQTLNQASMQVIQRELQIKPTLTVPVGYEFNILIDKDLYLEESESSKATDKASR